MPNVYEIVTQRIIESLETGTVPWQCPWKKGEHGIPRNFVSAKPYRGINPFMLTMASIARGYQSPFWVSYNQAKSLGGNVKAGEKSPAFVVFFKVNEKKDSEGQVIVNERGNPEHYPMLRYTAMFNTDQCEGLKVPDLSNPEGMKHNPIETAERIVSNMPNRPEIRIQQSNRAFYRPDSDFIVVPQLSQFRTAEEYYSTLFHEMGHSTGHKSRLDREFGSSFGDHTYSREELVAEFTASFLCGIAGIENRTIENSAAYLGSWLKVLKDNANSKWLVWAASRATAAAEYIQGKATIDENSRAA